VATSKKSVSKAAKTPAKSPKKGRSFSISIDLSALDKLYKNRYVITLDGGDTKGGSVKMRDGDTKGGGIAILPPIRRGTKPASAPAKKRSPKKKT
jgi:hypothetical protein